MTPTTKDKLNFITQGNQVYRGVEVDYSTYQQQSQQQSEQQPLASIVVLSMLRNEIPDTFTGNLSCSD
jgi:hypothetical protein